MDLEERGFIVGTDQGKDIANNDTEVSFLQKVAC
jgi:hypothetical protein